MKRRSFLQSSVAGLSVAVAADCVAGESKSPAQELYELRMYSLKAAKQPQLDDYLSKAFIPAVKRLGIGPVGVFVEKVDEENVRTLVLIVHPTPEHVTTLSARLTADSEHQKAAAKYLAAPASDPVYQRIESSLLTPFEKLPMLAKPDTTKPRLFNLRTYESHNERAGKKKIEMFNKGELAIFTKTGLTPVFFGETIVGSVMPNLTYLLVFPDEPGRKSAWERFIADPEWLKLRAIPEYADKEIVSRITNRILTPTAYSEI